MRSGGKKEMKEGDLRIEGVMLERQRGRKLEQTQGLPFTVIILQDNRKTERKAKTYPV